MDDLSKARSLDFSKLPLNYDRFRQLAANPHISDEEKIAFPPSYRRGFENAITSDILGKLPALLGEEKTVVDIGCGVGGLTKRIVKRCARQKHRLVLVDSEEMLGQAPDGDGVTKVAGMYPTNADKVREAAGGGADAILCYSVLHYVFVDTNPFTFLDSIIELLKVGGRALIGDVPNASKRRRFFTSPTGVDFHKQFMKTDQAPVVEHLKVQHGAIDDGALAGLIAHAQAAGCDAYLVPQGSLLPMANRRDDLLIVKP